MCVFCIPNPHHWWRLQMFLVDLSSAALASSLPLWPNPLLPLLWFNIRVNRVSVSLIPKLVLIAASAPVSSLASSWGPVLFCFPQKFWVKKIPNNNLSSPSLSVFGKYFILNIYLKYKCHGVPLPSGELSDCLLYRTQEMLLCHGCIVYWGI